jgi:hypothetical protein
VANYLVTYDLVGQETSPKYKRVIAEIEKLDDHLEVQRSVWLVKSSRSAKELREALWAHMERSDRLFVIRITRGSAWKNVLPGNPRLKKFFAG